MQSRSRRRLRKQTQKLSHRVGRQAGYDRTLSKKLTVSRKAMTKTPRGAPKKDFVHDPERYAVARADAYRALGVSENDAFMTAAARRPWRLPARRHFLTDAAGHGD